MTFTLSPPEEGKLETVTFGRRTTESLPRSRAHLHSHRLINEETEPTRLHHVPKASWAARAGPASSPLCPEESPAPLFTPFLCGAQGLSALIWGDFPLGGISRGKPTAQTPFQGTCLRGEGRGDDAHPPTPRSQRK